MVERRLWLFQYRSVFRLPTDPAELKRLAHQPSDEPTPAVRFFLAETNHVTCRARELFDEIVVAAAEPARDHVAESGHHGLGSGLRLRTRRRG